MYPCSTLITFAAGVAAGVLMCCCCETLLQLRIADTLLNGHHRPSSSVAEGLDSLPEDNAWKATSQHQACANGNFPRDNFRKCSSCSEEASQGRVAPHSVAAILPQRRSSVHVSPFGTKYNVTLMFRTPPNAAEVLSPAMENITFAAHVTVDRLPHVIRWCMAWRGPMSISIFVRTRIDELTDVVKQFAGNKCIARHAVLHVVSEMDTQGDAGSPAGAAPHRKGKDMMVHYPSNIQRNAALDGCTGDLALLMDIDFHLRPSLMSGAGGSRGEVRLRQHFRAAQDTLLRRLQSQNRDPESEVEVATTADDDVSWVRDAAVVVIPAVETVTNTIPIPSSIEELSEAVAAHKACDFYGHYCRHCHHPTNLRQFLRSKEPYLIDYEEGYEPYVIVNRSSRTNKGYAFPKYNETFFGRFGDKYSFFYEVAAQGRPFVVLPGYFLVHHGRGDDVQWPKKPSEEYKIREMANIKLFADFRALIEVKYNGYTSTRRLQPDAAADVDEHSDALHVSRDNNIAVPVSDALILFASTEEVPWADISTDISSASRLQRAIATQLDGSPHTSVGDAVDDMESPNVICVAAHRDGPAEPLDALQHALSWVCERMDCTALQEGSPFTRNLIAHADWAFQRWFFQATRVRRQPAATSCHFGGAAKFALPAPEVVDIMSRLSEGSDATLTTLAGSAGMASETMRGTVVVGCTLNGEYPVTESTLTKLINKICEGTPDAAIGGVALSAYYRKLLKQSHAQAERSSATSVASAEGATSPTAHLDLEVDLGFRSLDTETDAVQLGVPDAMDVIGVKQCDVLFSKMHNLTAADVRVVASVALHAHHVMFWGGGEGRTCRGRFGDVASYIVV